MSYISAPTTESQGDSDEYTLRVRFDEQRIGRLAEEFLALGTSCDLKAHTKGRQFVVAYIPATSRFADIPRSVEANVFAETFDLSLREVVDDYGRYDPASVFATVIDVSTTIPCAAGALRITEFDPALGFKDVNDLLRDDRSNPWIEEIKSGYFAPDEQYDPAIAWRRLGERACGRELRLDESVDIATHASALGYRGKRGDLSGVSMLFYHACLRYALAHHKANLLAIFDLPPLANLQQFGGPFGVYDGLAPHPYGGPYDTVPAYCIINEGMPRIRNFNEAIGRVFIDGESLRDMALLPSVRGGDILRPGGRSAWRLITSQTSSLTPLLKTALRALPV